MRRIAAIAVLLAAVNASAGNSGTASFVVIVNAANGATPTAIEIAGIFMKRMTRWKDDGLPIAVVDGVAGSPVRVEFSRVVLHRGVDAVEAYWQQQLFSGRDVPPLEKETDAEILAFVRKNRGAIGYVGAGAPRDGVRVVFGK